MRRHVSALIVAVVLSFSDIQGVAAAPNAVAANASQMEACDLMMHVSLLRVRARRMQEQTGRLFMQSNTEPALKAMSKEVAFLELLSQRVAINSVELLDSSDVDPEVIFGLGRDVMHIRETLAVIETGLSGLSPAAQAKGEIKGQVSALQKSFRLMENSLRPLLTSPNKIKEAIKACAA